MEVKKYLVFFVAVLLPTCVSAYDAETSHRHITNEAISFFQNNFPNRFSDAEIQSILKGSVVEDESIRSLKHFFDPVYNRGIRGMETSKEWANNTPAQGGFVVGPNNYLAGTIKTYFSADSDYTWDRAVYDYVYGNKYRGLESLGHVIHLVQDATVPDHTRNDPHIPFFTKYIGQASPYEMYSVGQTGALVNRLVIDGKKPVTLSSLNEYFDTLANFSNKNYFSQDTILGEDYVEPKIDKEINIEDEIFGIGNVDGEEQKIVKVILSQDYYTRSLTRSYSLIDKNNIILSTYYSTLSEQAVLHSAGVIKLFFDRVEEEKRTHALLHKNKSFAQRAWDAAKEVTGDLMAFVGITGKQDVATTTSPIAERNDAVETENDQVEIDAMYATLKRMNNQTAELVSQRFGDLPPVNGICPAIQ